MQDLRLYWLEAIEIVLYYFVTMISMWEHSLWSIKIASVYVVYTEPIFMLHAMEHSLCKRVEVRKK